MKYDNEITTTNRPGKTPLQKGFYSSERPIIDRVHRDALRGRADRMRTIECQIMDLADDIAYSTYDLEDAFKGGLLSPLDLLYADDKTLSMVAERVGDELGFNETVEDVRLIVGGAFQMLDHVKKSSEYTVAKLFLADGFYRTALTSSLVGDAIRGVSVKLDETCPPLSKIAMKDAVRHRVSALKAPRLRPANRIESPEGRGSSRATDCPDDIRCPEWRWRI